MRIYPMRYLSIPSPASSSFSFFSSSSSSSHSASKPCRRFPLSSRRSLRLPHRAFCFSRKTASSCQSPVYVYPDPIPEFSKAESRRFEGELRKKLLRSKEVFEDDMDVIVKLCVEIFSEFLHEEYGGPGTLSVEPFTDMLLSLKEKKLPGAPVAARAALLWAQNHVDQDWEIWNSQRSR